MKLYLIATLPGLGKSYLGKNNSNCLDYEDWIESKNRSYKEGKEK